MSKLKILIVDDYPIFRAGLREILSKIPGFEVIGEAANGQLAIEKARQLKPQLILMDLAMPIMNGIEAIRIIKQHQSTIKIIALTAQYHVEATLAAGADGYALKDDSSLKLLTAIDSVMNGQIYLSPSICNTVLNGSPGNSAHIRSAASWRRLSEQERKKITNIAED